MEDVCWWTTCLESCFQCYHLTVTLNIQWWGRLRCKTVRMHILEIARHWPLERLRWLQVTWMVGQLMITCYLITFFWLIVPRYLHHHCNAAARDIFNCYLNWHSSSEHTNRASTYTAWRLSLFTSTMRKLNHMYLIPLAENFVTRLRCMGMFPHQQLNHSSRISAWLHPRFVNLLIYVYVCMQRKYCKFTFILVFLVNLMWMRKLKKKKKDRSEMVNAVWFYIDFSLRYDVAIFPPIHQLHDKARPWSEDCFCGHR